MSTKFHDENRGGYRNGVTCRRQALLRANVVNEHIYASTIKDHYFKVYRLGEDMCAKCGKKRAEHSSVTRRPPQCSE